jgi:hypothetical protein
MRLSPVGYLIARTRRQNIPASVSEFGVQLALQAKENVTLGAPVVGEVTRGILDHAHPDCAELPGSPEGSTTLTGVLHWRNRRPVGGTEGNVTDLHALNFLETDGSPGAARLLGSHKPAFPETHQA